MNIEEMRKSPDVRKRVRAASISRDGGLDISWAIADSDASVRHVAAYACIYRKLDRAWMRTDPEPLIRWLAAEADSVDNLDLKWARADSDPHVRQVAEEAVR